MAKTVTKYVTTTNPETQEVVTFEPGDELPEWAEEVITNPACFDENEDEPREIPASGEGGGNIFVPDSVQQNQDDDDEPEIAKQRPRNRRNR